MMFFIINYNKFTFPWQQHKFATDRTLRFGRMCCVIYNKKRASRVVLQNSLAMGNSGARQWKESDEDREYVLISTEPGVETLSFNPAQSYLLAFGMNKQTSPAFRACELGNTAINCAHIIISPLKKKIALPRANSILLVPSADPDNCTLQGMKKTLQEEARKVGEEGAFFFHFSGHGIRVNNQFALAPSDYNRTQETCITASMLSKWLNEAGIKAKYVIISLDCCYAGGIAEALTKGSENIVPIPGLYVLAACMANETSASVESLGSSVFSYFLSHAIRTSVPFLSPGEFPLQQIHKKCRKLTKALTSLLLSYDRNAGIQKKMIRPQIAHFDPIVTSFSQQADATDTGGSIMSDGAFQLNHKSLVWLESCYAANTDDPGKSGGLVVLKEEGVLGEEHHELMITVLCFMLRSVALIQLDCNSSTVTSPTLYNIAYTQVANIIDSQCGVKFNNTAFLLGLDSYIDCLLPFHELNLEPLQQFRQDTRVGREGTDSAVSVTINLYESIKLLQAYFCIIQVPFEYLVCFSPILQDSPVHLQSGSKKWTPLDAFTTD